MLLDPLEGLHCVRCVLLTLPYDGLLLGHLQAPVLVVNVEFLDYQIILGERASLVCETDVDLSKILDVLDVLDLYLKGVDLLFFLLVLLVEMLVHVLEVLNHLLVAVLWEVHHMVPLDLPFLELFECFYGQVEGHWNRVRDEHYLEGDQRQNMEESIDALVLFQAFKDEWVRVLSQREDLR